MRRPSPALAVAALSLAAAPALAADATAPRFNASGELQRPADYRSWVFLTSGLGMTYGSTSSDAGRPAPFTNVFVNPEAYRAFMASGRWP